MGVEDESPSIAAAAFCCAPASEMQKAEDAADMSVLFFFQLVLTFWKATHVTMQVLVLAASRGSSVST